jgi:hypothetical protein
MNCLRPPQTGGLEITQTLILRQYRIYHKTGAECQHDFHFHEIKRFMILLIFLDQSRLGDLNVENQEGAVTGARTEENYL